MKSCTKNSSVRKLYHRKLKFFTGIAYAVKILFNTSIPVYHPLSLRKLSLSPPHIPRNTIQYPSIISNFVVINGLNPLTLEKFIKLLNYNFRTKP